MATNMEDKTPNDEEEWVGYDQEEYFEHYSPKIIPNKWYNARIACSIGSFCRDEDEERCSSAKKSRKVGKGKDPCKEKGVIGKGKEKEEQFVDKDIGVEKGNKKQVQGENMDRVDREVSFEEMKILDETHGMVEDDVPRCDSRRHINDIIGQAMEGTMVHLILSKWIFNKINLISEKVQDLQCKMDIVERDTRINKDEQDNSNMLVIFEEVAKDVTTLRTNYESKINILEDTILKVYQKLEMMVNVRKSCIQNSVDGLKVLNEQDEIESWGQE